MATGCFYEHGRERLAEFRTLRIFVNATLISEAMRSTHNSEMQQQRVEKVMHRSPGKRIRLREKKPRKLAK